jgi:hypothetical protein
MKHLLFIVARVEYLRHNVELMVVVLSGLGQLRSDIEFLVLIVSQVTRVRGLELCDRVKISRSDGYRPLKLSPVCDCIIEEDGESSRHDHSRE